MVSIYFSQNIPAQEESGVCRPEIWLVVLAGLQLRQQSFLSTGETVKTLFVASSSYDARVSAKDALNLVHAH